MKIRIFQIIALCFLFGYNASSQVLSCNNNINMSLDGEGEAEIYPEIILEGVDYSEFDSLWVDKTLLTCDDIASSPIEITVYGKVAATGDIITCWSSITVEDKLPPIAIVNTDVEIDISGGPVVIDPAIIDEGSYDNCGIVSYTVEPSIIDCNTAPPYFVTFTVEDEAGHTNQAITQIIISGDIASNGAGLLCAANGPLNVINGPVKLKIEDMIISGPTACSDNYSFHYENINPGGPAPTDTIFDASYAGETYKVTVLEWVTGITCEREFTVVAEGEPFGFCVNDFDGQAIKDVEIIGGVTTEENGCATIYSNTGSTIIANKTDAPNNGVDAIDALIIRAAILAQTSLTNDQSFAADLSGNGNVSTLDLVYLEKMAMGEFTPEKVWYFYNSDTEIGENDTPADLEQAIEIENGISNYSFTGLKMGDVDLSYNFVPTSDDDMANLSVTDIALNKGETHQVPLYMSESSTLLAADISIPVETDDYKITNVTSMLTDFVYSPSISVINGVLNIKWVANDDILEAGGQTINADEMIFNLTIEAKENGILSNTFTLLSDETNKWRRNGMEFNTEYLELNIDGQLTLSTFNTEFETFTISPNPAHDMIVINTEEDLSNADYTIYDFTGSLKARGTLNTANIIDIKSLPIGMYNVVIQKENNILTQKLTVIR